MPVAFPAALPGAHIRGYTVQPRALVRRTPLDAGEPRVRRLYRAVPAVAQVRWRFTQAQYAAWHQWYEEDLLAGVLEFDAPLHGPAAPALLPARCIEYSAQLQAGNYWLVDAQLLLSVVT